MFPYVEGEQRGEPVLKGILRVAALGDEELAVVVAAEPYPARAEQPYAGLDESVLNLSNEPKSRSMALRSSPPGSLDPSGEKEKK